jgi:hypothetical protein
MDRLRLGSRFPALGVALAGIGAVLLAWVLPMGVRADVGIPLRIEFYFEQDGRPYNGPVRFTVACYGYTYPVGPEVVLEPGSYEPSRVYTISGDCPAYGCAVDHVLVLHYMHIDWCDLVGYAGEVAFQITDYAQAPVDVGACSGPTGEPPHMACPMHFAIPADVPLPPGPPLPAATDLHEGGGLALVRSFLAALAVTLAVELPVLWVLARFVLRLAGVSTARLLGVGVLASALTLPLLWFVLPVMLPAVPALLAGEALAVALEALLYWWLLKARSLAALFLSLAANLASYWVGLLVF